MNSLFRSMTGRLAVTSTAIALIASCSAAHTEVPGVAAPTTSESGPATSEAGSAGSAIEELLVAMESAGKDFETLAAQVLLTERNSLTGEDVRRAGRFWLSRGEEETRFHVVFLGIVVEEDGKELLKPEKIEYLLAGDTLIDRNHRTRTQVSRTLAPEQADRDLLKLGEGPFPLPIGQSPQAVRDQFEVSLVDPETVDIDEGDVPIYSNTRRLRLVPKGPPLSDDFSFVEIDVEPETGRPRQVITLDASGENLKITELRGIEIDPELDPAVFELEKIDLSGWNLTSE